MKKKPQQQTLMVSASPMILLPGDAVVEDSVIIEQDAPVEATPVAVAQPHQSTPISTNARNRKQELTTVDQDIDSDFLKKVETESEASAPSAAPAPAASTRATRAAKTAAASTISASEASEEEAASEEAAATEEKESTEEGKGVKRTRSGRTVTAVARDESAAGDQEHSPTRKSARTAKK